MDAAFTGRTLVEMMTRCPRISVLLIAVFALQPASLLAGAQPERQLTWAQAAPLLPGGYVELHLVNQDRLWGRVLVTTKDHVRLDVDRASNFLVYPSGVTTISGDTITLVKRRRWGPAAAGIGAGIAVAVVGPLTQDLSASGHGSKAWLAIEGGGALGAWLGRQLSGPTLLIRIVPEAGRRDAADLRHN